ncbi:carbohydrate kinase protein [Haloferula helveola]|uniref:Bifunctional NAD(P)H-hydrate repair enzyme n=1 Tax=Haloferula helveola TaxID=490095 RepID=A0ABM7RCM8_9BACT|nr:carbohydrate kinase protein [Haloferula helveola]
MGWVTAGEMRAIEEAAFRDGVDAGDLMDAAGAGIARLVLESFPTPGTAVAFIGKGNNGGDALVVLEHLRKCGWRVAFRPSHPETERSILTRQRGRRLGIGESPGIPDGPGPLLLLDGLLGIGAGGPLREPLAGLAAGMNELRTTRGAIVAAIDLPSGIDTDSGEPYEGAVVADLTLTIGVPKRGLFADAATNHCGRLYLVPVPELPPPDRTGPRITCPANFPDLLPPRPHDFHKGNAGRVAVLAGSPGMSGAAELCATGGLRGGAGLVTLFLDPDNLARPTPEIMVRHVSRRIEAAFDFAADARVIGPGLGTLTPPQIEQFLERLAADDRPTVLDADALNLLAAHGKVDALRPNHLITPHPGEFARLAPDLAGLPRADAVARFVDRHPCTLLLKGARTIVAAESGDLRFNPTGHAGMASGGQGDVLAGVCGALLAAGHASADAAMLGAWLCGRSAERAISHGGQSEESCTAGDTLVHLGGAFLDWREQRR